MEPDREQARRFNRKAAGDLSRTEDTVQIKPSEYLDLLRNRDYLRIWIAQMVSAVGDWVIVAALFTYVDTLSGGRSSAISVMMVARFLPAILMGFLAGVIIDRFDRKATMISCDMARAAVVIIMPFSNSLLMICVMVFLMETFTAIYGPAKDSSIPDLVRPDQLANANSMNSVTMFAAMAFGTAIAGAVVGLINWVSNIDANRATFFLDSITFFISAYLVWRINFKKRGPDELVKFSSQQVKTDVRDGFRYMRSHALTRTVLILVVVCFLGGGTIYVLAVGFVKYVLGGGDASFMAVLTTLLFGLMTGALLAGLLKNILAKEKWLGWAILAFGTCVSAFSLVAWFWLTYILAFLAGSCMGYAAVGMMTLLHETLEEEYRGRVFSTINMLMRTSIFLSIIVAGPLADLINWLGETWGVGAQDFGVIRIGGYYAGQVDDKYVDFRYILNGPQLILLLGGIIIIVAGLYARRKLHEYFTSPEGVAVIEARQAAVLGIETITLAEGAEAAVASGSGEDGKEGPEDGPGEAEEAGPDGLETGPETPGEGAPGEARTEVTEEETDG